MLAQSAARRPNALAAGVSRCRDDARDPPTQHLFSDWLDRILHPVIKSGCEAAVHDGRRGYLDACDSFEKNRRRRSALTIADGLGDFHFSARRRQQPHALLEAGDDLPMRPGLGLRLAFRRHWRMVRFAGLLSFSLPAGSTRSPGRKGRAVKACVNKACTT